jgi:hypothetical protein
MERGFARNPGAGYPRATVVYFRATGCPGLRDREDAVAPSGLQYFTEKWPGFRPGHHVANRS